MEDNNTAWRLDGTGSENSCLEEQAWEGILLLSETKGGAPTLTLTARPNKINSKSSSSVAIAHRTFSDADVISHLQTGGTSPRSARDGWALFLGALANQNKQFSPSFTISESAAATAQATSDKTGREVGAGEPSESQQQQQQQHEKETGKDDLPRSAQATGCITLFVRYQLQNVQIELELPLIQIGLSAVVWGLSNTLFEVLFRLPPKSVLLASEPSLRQPQQPQQQQEQQQQQQSQATHDHSFSLPLQQQQQQRQQALGNEKVTKEPPASHQCKGKDALRKKKRKLGKGTEL
jgi:hypothetical protein